MIVVQPAPLSISKQLSHNRFGIYRTERQCLKSQEATALRFLVRNHQQGVLDTHTETAFQVDTRLVSHRHTCTQLSRFPLHTNLVRSFVNVQVATDTVTRTMQEVQTSLPQGLTGNSIYLRTCGTLRELQQLQVDMSLQHQRIDAALFVGQRTKGDGTRDIRRTVLILSATV